jgi:hypothetical protein
MKHRELDKKYRQLGKRWRRLRARGEDSDTTKQYTPQDVHALLHNKGNGAGIIRPGTSDLHLPANLDALGEGKQSDSPLRVMVVIVTLALIFIAIITYFISQMPNKD